MALPKIAVPKYKLKLPSSGKEVFYRPFLVKEEKTLLMAIEGGDQADLTESVINIINACVDYDGDVRALPFFDIEYIFVQLRARSINNILELNLKHSSSNECQHVTPFKLNLEDVTVTMPKNKSNIIQITDDIGIKLKYPTINTVDELGESIKSSQVDQVFRSLAVSVECVFDKEEVYDDFTVDEMVEYLGNLNKEQFFKVIKFFEEMPTVSYDIKYKCEKCDKEEHIPMKGLQSFFM